MKGFFKSYLTFSKSEKWMIWVYAVLISGFSIYLIYINWFAPKVEFVVMNERLIPASFFESNSTSISSQGNIDPFEFDPNTASKEELIQLGMKSFLAERLIKYRQKVNLNKPDDLKKLYGIDSSWVDRIAPFMLFEKQTVVHQKGKNQNLKTSEQNDNAPKRYPEKPIKPEIKVYLNAADQSDWMDLKGVGPTLSGRIVTYREKLGGFINPWQLLEVWGIDSSIIENNLSLLEMDIENIQKINLNSDSFKYLINHPYIDYKSASLIMSYRKQHGNYSNISQLFENKGLKKEFIEKIKPYAKFD